MKLRTKILGSLFLLALVSIGVMYFSLKATLIKGLLDLEKEDQIRNVQRVMGTIKESNDVFVVKLADWSAWDDTYQFIMDGNKKYEKSNLGWNTFDILAINLLLYVDKDLHIKYFRGRDYTHEIIFPTPPAEILQFMREKKELFNWKSTRDFKVGFVRSGNEVFQLVLAPITDTKREAAPRGTFFGARFFRETELKRLEEITHYTIATRLIEPTEAAVVTDEIIVNRVSEQLVEGKTILRDIFGKPILEITVQSPRLLYKQGLESFKIVLVLVIGISIALLLGVSFLLNRLMLSRISAIHTIVNNLQDNEKESPILKLNSFGDDEIGVISSEIHDLYSRVIKLADYDDLTEIHNVRYFKLNGERQLKLAQRHARPLSVILFDVDFFKKVNDTYGHIQGDVVLRRLGALLKTNMRQSDLCARYGGEEFVIMVLETDAEGALAVAEKIRSSVELLEIPQVAKGAAPLKITVSLGVAAFTAGLTLEQLIEKADQALYAAKEGGRNRVVMG